MKTILTFVIIIFFFFFNYGQKNQFGMNLFVNIPNSVIMPKMNNNYGFGLSGSWSPSFRTPFYIELKGNWGSYSSKTLEQTYQFTDGTQTITNVSYTSSMSNYMLGIKSMILNNYRPIRFFGTPLIGMGKFKTKIVVNEPNDQDQCQALDRETVQKYTGFIWGLEGGIEIGLNKVFNPSSEGYKHKLVLSVNTLRGVSPFEYVNVEYMQNEVHNPITTHETAEIKANFINISTKQIHEHKIAELYHTSLQMWTISVGYYINF